VRLEVTKRNVEVFLFRIEQGTGYTTNNPLRFVDDNGSIKRDASGNVVFEQTGSGTVNFGSFPAPIPYASGVTEAVTWQADFGHVFADNGTPIDASRATSGIQVTLQDPNGQTIGQGGPELLNAGSGFSNTADCHGTTFASGQVWINNDQVPAIISGDHYTQTSTPFFNDVGVYSQNGDPATAVHSVGVSGLDSQTGAVTQVASKGWITPMVATTPAEAWAAPAALTYYHQTPPPPPPPPPPQQNQH